MAKGSDDDILVLLREIRTTRKDQAAELNLFGPVAGSVANLNHDVRWISTKLSELDEKMTGLDEKVIGLDDKVDRFSARGGDEMKSLRGELEIMKLDAHDARFEMHEMRSDIHALQSDVHELKLTATSHGLRFDFPDERVEMLREGTLRAIEAAVGVSGANAKGREDLAARTKRVEKLEASR